LRNWPFRLRPDQPGEAIRAHPAPVGRFADFSTPHGCEKDAIAWDEIAMPGTDPHSLAHPASRLMLHHDWGHEHQH
jgi:uncharacterized protein YcnI